MTYDTMTYIGPGTGTIAVADDDGVLRLLDSMAIAVPPGLGIGPPAAGEFHLAFLPPSWPVMTAVALPARNLDELRASLVQATERSPCAMFFTSLARRSPARTVVKEFSSACPACGSPARKRAPIEVWLGPNGEHIPYALCLACDEAGKRSPSEHARVLARLQLRLGLMRGRA